MTHPLTKKLNTESMNDDEIIQSWAKARAEILKKTAYDGVITPKMIDQAFQTIPETCSKCGQGINS